MKTTIEIGKWIKFFLFCCIFFLNVWFLFYLSFIQFFYFPNSKVENLMKNTRTMFKETDEMLKKGWIAIKWKKIVLTMKLQDKILNKKFKIVSCRYLRGYTLMVIFGSKYHEDFLAILSCDISYHPKLYVFQNRIVDRNLLI